MIEGANVMKIPGPSVSLGDGRFVEIGRVVDCTVRIRQTIPGSNVSIFDQRQPGLLDRMRGDVELGWDSDSLFPRREWLTWVITHVALIGSPGSIELLHRRVKRSFASPWLKDGIQLVMPIDVTHTDHLAVWSGQQQGTETVILLRGLMIWSPEMVKAEKP